MRERIYNYIAFVLGVTSVATPAVFLADKTTSIVSAAATDSSTANLLRQKQKDFQKLQLLPSFKPSEQLKAVAEGIEVKGVGTCYPTTERTKGFGVECFMVKEPMLSTYLQIGGVGDVISREYTDEAGRPSQLTHKIGIQLNAEGKGSYYPSYLNVFDELQKAGKDDWLASVRSVPASFDWSSDVGKSWGHTSNSGLPGTIEENHLKILDSYPVLKEAYLANPYWFEQNGLPMSVENNGTFTTVRGQRAALQEWHVDAPWAKKGQVVVANGGLVAIEAGIIPPEALKPEAIDNETALQYPSYYSQFLHGENFVIRAAEKVNPQSLKEAESHLAYLMSRLKPEYKNRFTVQNPAAIIIPANQPYWSIPEISNLFRKRRILNPEQGFQPRGLGFIDPDHSNSLMVAVGEETLLNLAGYDKRHYFYHEWAHLVQYTFQPEENSFWLNNIYLEALNSGRSVQFTSCDLNIYKYIPKCAEEYWADLSRMFMQNEADKIARYDPQALAFMQRVYK